MTSALVLRLDVSKLTHMQILVTLEQPPDYLLRSLVAKHFRQQTKAIILSHHYNKPLKLIRECYIQYRNRKKR